MNEKPVFRIVHPAVWLLFKSQMSGKWNATRTFVTERSNRIPMLLAVFLFVIWSGQLVFGALTRTPIIGEHLPQRLAMTFGVIALLPLVKLILWPTLSPPWTPVESNLIHRGPFSAYDRVVWRLLRSFPVCVFFAVTGTIMLLPEKASVSFALFGLLLVSMTMSAMHYGWQCVVYDIRPHQRLRLRLILLCTVLGSMIVYPATLRVGIADDELQTNLLESHLSASFGGAGHRMIRFLLWPFRQFAGLVTASEINVESVTTLGQCLFVSSTVIAIVWLIEWKFGFDSKDAILASADVRQATGPSRSILRTLRIPYLLGLGPIVWRQLIRLRDKLPATIAGSLPVAVVPILASQLKLTGNQAFLVSGLFLGILSFLLLPTVFRFDFRNDFEHLSLFRRLAISPSAVVVGQLLVPVSGLVIIQFTVLGILICILKIDFALILASVIMFPFLSILIVGFENYLFLMSPYPDEDFNLSTVMRTLLTFTAKILLIAALTMILLMWAFLVSTLTATFNMTPFSLTVCFSVGCAMLLAVASGSLLFATQTRLISLDWDAIAGR